MLLAKIAAVSFIICVITHALKGALDKLTGKYASLQKLDDVVTKVSDIEDKVDSFLQSAAAPKA